MSGPIKIARQVIAATRMIVTPEAMISIGLKPFYKKTYRAGHFVGQVWGYLFKQLEQVHIFTLHFTYKELFGALLINLRF